MMYYLGSRWRRQTLVYFGEPQDLAYRHTRKKDGARVVAARFSPEVSGFRLWKSGSFRFPTEIRNPL